MPKLRSCMYRYGCIALLLLIAKTSVFALSLRQDTIINREWRFQLGDFPGAEAATFDDSSWQTINVPHSFDLPYFMSKDFYVGYGWYRKHINVPTEWKSKRVFLEFEGAFQDAEIYVNGAIVGEHKGGFTGFSFDITPNFHAGDNVLAVRLNNNWNPQIEPRSGDHTFMGGIYRNVHLVVTDPLHVTWYGTFVTTPVVGANAATVNVKTEIANATGTATECTVDTDIIDPNGKVVARLSSHQTVGAGTVVTFDQTTPALATPQLWHPAHPLLYLAHTTVLNANQPVDDYDTPFGIRSIRWTADEGFFINGDHYYFHGANVHQDHAGWGDAATDAGAFRDVFLVKGAGLNFIRGSHYPHSPAFATACDKLGVLFWSENCFWGCGRGNTTGYWTADGYPPDAADQGPFEQNALNTLRDEIRIFRNHPSIVVWSMCNEVFFLSGPDQGENLGKVKNLLRQLVAKTHELDPTRPAAIGGAQRGGLDKIGDIAGYNGDGASLKEYQNPGIPNVVSEYGSHISDRGDLRTDIYSGLYNPSELGPDTPEYPWRSGQALWCAFDYSTILGHFGCMGFVDYFRIPKRSWYWYRNKYLHIPPPEWPQPGTPAKLALSADKTKLNGTNGTDDSQILVTVEDSDGKALSNSPPVTFTIVSGPGEFPTGRSITFSPPSSEPKSDIAIRDGKAAIEFRSYFGGQTVISATSPGLQEGTVTITTTGDPAFIPGHSPLAPDRPYVRFVAHHQDQPIDQNLALNHPVTASGELPGNEARLADDGNTSTGWRPPDDGTETSWQIDLEGFNKIRAVEMDFATPANYTYKIEVSADGTSWSEVAARSGAGKETATCRETCTANTHVRFLKVTFTDVFNDRGLTLNEIKILGRPSP